MRILVGSKNAWNDMNAVGNTLSNWFGGQEDMTFSSLYSRSELPANRVCEDYYRITETGMIKNILTPEKIGNHFSLTAEGMNFSPLASEGAERKAINFVKSHSVRPVYALSDRLWKSGKWINAKLKRYIGNFNPDIFFSFATEPVILRQRMQLVKELCGAKTVLFVADDVYSVFIKENDKRVTDDFRWCIENADLLYGASEELCREYEREFGREFGFLYKGCKVRDVADDKPLSPIRLVYAGNLFYGRDETLAQLTEAVKRINESSDIKLFTEIYTASPVTQEMSERLNVSGAGRIMGARAYEEIIDIMHSAHIALQVESFEPSEIEKVRLSFSTKISDCLQSGSAVMAIGPEGISSIEYLKKVDGAAVITDPRDIYAQLEELVREPRLLRESALRVNRFAKERHDIASVRKRIRNDFINICKD